MELHIFRDQDLQMMYQHMNDLGVLNKRLVS